MAWTPYMYAVLTWALRKQAAVRPQQAVPMQQAVIRCANIFDPVNARDTATSTQDAVK